MSRDYKPIIDPQGYVNKKEITNLNELFLVTPSKNVLINDGDKVSTRQGYSLYGSAYSVNKPIKGSYEWDTSSARQRALRSYDDELEVYYDSSWRRVKNRLSKSSLSFDTWWDSTENIDLLLFVLGDDNIYDWSGAITKIASVTATTITKLWYVTGATYTFDASDKTIVDSGSGFVTAGFAVGDSIVVSGSASNDGTYTILTVTASTITVIPAETLVDETAGATVVIKKENFGSWAEERFLTAGTRKVIIDGIVDGSGNPVEFTYTGGESGGVLTGVTPDPTGYAISNGSIAIQAVRTNTDKPIAGNKNDILRVANNQAIIMSRSSREVYFSKITDFKDFAFTTPVRVPGEGALLTLDGHGSGIVPQEETVYLSAGKDFWYRVEITLSSDGQNETMTIKRLKTAPGAGALNQEAIANVKNDVAFISNEPTLDRLGRIENINTPQSVPLSDAIKRDFDGYDKTDAHVKYYRNALYVALPRAGVLLIYDFANERWQPPQTMQISRLAIIDGELYGHSGVRNETYKLFDGTNDNGNPISFVAAFAYRNYGDRTRQKVMDEYFTEMYASPNSRIDLTLYFDYQGSTKTVPLFIDASDEDIQYVVADDPSLGQNPLGYNPLGSSADYAENISKIRIIHALSNFEQEWFESQTVYTCDELDSVFEIVAHGGNARFSGNLPVNIIKNPIETTS